MKGTFARSFADAHEIDDQVYINDGQHLKAGDMVEVVITDSDTHDLWGDLV